jgi:hypothetical protein
MSFEQFIGLSGPEFEFPIELGKQREFAAAVHAFQPEFHEGPHPVIFPTLPIIAGYIWGYMLEEPRGTALKALDMEEAMSLDGEQEFFFHGPKPRAGDTLVARTWVDHISQKKGRRGGTLTFYRMRCDFKDAKSGDLKLTLLSTSVVPTNVPSETPVETREATTAYLKWGEKRDQFAAIRPADPSKISVGDTPGPVKMPPHTLSDCVRYQITTGSYGAGHHDSLAAHVTWPGDELVYRGHVSGIEKTNEGEKLVRLELAAERATGDAVTTAWADFVA